MNIISVANANVAKIYSYGKWVIIATILFLAHQGIKYQQYVTTFPNQLSPLFQRTLLVSTPPQPSPTTLHYSGSSNIGRIQLVRLRNRGILF